MANQGVWRPVAQNIEINALESNCNAVIAVADTVRTTLGPKGLDKLLIDQAMNRHVTNDGVTILLSLKTIHPVARMIVEIAERQEELVGDGTTTAVVMAAEMVKVGKNLIKELGVHPTKVVDGIDSGVKSVCQLLESEAKKVSIDSPELESVVRTSLASKLDGGKLAPIVIETIRLVGDKAKNNNEYDFDKSIMVIRKTNMSDSLFNGVVLERKRMDSEMPRDVRDAKILISKIDLKPIKESWIKDSKQYEDIMSMENDRAKRSKKIVDDIVATGANVVLIDSPEVDQYIENFFVSKKIMALRISSDEVEPFSRYTEARPVRMLEDLTQPNILGKADHIYEDDEKGLIFIESGSGSNIVTMIVSGTTKETSLERWRAARDGVNAAEAALNRGVVAGGGAAEIHIISKVKNIQLRGIESVGLDVVVAALESIMRQILTNAGFNGLEKVMAAKSSPDGYGIDIDTGDPVDMWSKGVIDPLLVKTTALEAAGEIAKSVLRIDRNLAAEELNMQAVSETRR